ncbi:MAG: hypothetical protein Q9193_006920 [Seirophora villosa]
MERQPKFLTDSVNLLRTCELLTAAVHTVIDEWAKEALPGIPSLPSQELYEAQRTVLAATGTLTELVSEPQSRVVEVAGHNLDAYTASDHLPTYLLGPDGHSYSVEKTAWQKAIGTTKPRWDWLEEEVTHEEGSALRIGYPGVVAGDVVFRDQPPATKLRRPEHEIFSLAMVGGGRIFGAAHPYDYPWNSLGEATIVDVGGGVGGFDMQLRRLYPKLNFVIQDRGPVLQRAAQNTWPKEASAALTDGRVRFMEHDFFNPNPVHGAEVYWLRYILHDWADDYCVQILSAIRVAMVPRSRILICDQVMNTTNGCAEFRSAPKPLLANYGYYTRYSHQRDLCMMGIFNGIERTPAQLEVLIENAGLKLEKRWECRSQVSIVEVRLRGTLVEEDGEVTNGANRHHDRTKNPDELPTPAF